MAKEGMINSQSCNLKPERFIRKSKRRSGKEIMSQLFLGKGYRNVNFATISKFVSDEIVENKPLIVDLPTYPERHTILIHVMLDQQKIMVSDWGGLENETRGERGNKGFDERFIAYSQFMKLLSKKYELPIEFYPEDDELYNEALKHHKSFKNKSGGHGGCSFYIFKWVCKYYPDYS
jgi:hypothetical protein